jgi:hypothetical protein
VTTVTVLITAAAGVIAWLALCVIVLALGLRGVRITADGRAVGDGVVRVTPGARQSSTDELKRAAETKGDAELDEAAHVIKGLSRVRSIRVLWVDDNPGGNVDETLALLKLGLNVIPVATTDLADLYLNSTHFDLVITDMTRGDDPEAGLKVIALLKTIYARRQAEAPPLIVYSADPGDRGPRAIAEGASRVTRTPGQLANAVAHLIAGGVRRPTLLGRVRDALRLLWSLAIGGSNLGGGPVRPWWAPATWLDLLRTGWVSRRGLVFALALTPIAATAGVVLLVLQLNRTLPVACVPLRSDAELSVALDAPGCAVPVGPTALRFDCSQQVGIPPDVLLRESRDYASNHPAPAPGDGTVMVQDAACVIADPRPGVETQLRTSAAQPADAVAVVDFTPTSTSSQVVGVSLRGSPASAGVGVYLSAGGGQFAEDTAGSTAFQQLNGGAFSQAAQPNQQNRLVLCVQGGRVQGWLNGQRLGPSDLSTRVPAAPGGLVLSDQDFDTAAQPAMVAINRIAVYRTAPQGCAV